LSSETSAATPILIYEALHCPHCRCPLKTEELGYENWICVYCGGRIGKLTDEAMMELVKAIPMETKLEWANELKFYREEAEKLLVRKPAKIT